MDKVRKDISDTLKGQPFIESVQKYTNPEDLAFGEQIERTCGYCFYRAFEGNKDGDCHLVENNAKTDFGFKPDEFLPKQIGGKEVGNYCTHFVNFMSE